MVRIPQTANLVGTNCQICHEMFQSMNPQFLCCNCDLCDIFFFQGEGVSSKNGGDRNGSKFATKQHKN